jgi:hypothetical protein
VKTKHTPGPWACVKDDDCDPPVAVIYGDNQELAGVYATKRTNRDFANGRLIAASPALLAACKRAIKAMKQMSPTHFTNELAAALVELRDAVEEAE